eukprot:4207392-Lingulodinium_polyedra.AAC.1
MLDDKDGACGGNEEYGGCGFFTRYCTLRETCSRVVCYKIVVCAITVASAMSKVVWASTILYRMPAGSFHAHRDCSRCAGSASKGARAAAMNAYTIHVLLARVVGAEHPGHVFRAMRVDGLGSPCSMHYVIPLCN